MKLLLTILSIMTFTSCSCTKNLSSEQSLLSKENASSEKIVLQDKPIYFEYKAITRGSLLIVTASNDGYYFTAVTAPNMKPSKQNLSNEDWKNLMIALEKINLDNLPNIEPPSTNHQFDAALIATLKIIVDGKEYQTMAFDHGNPPQELEEIVKILISFSEKE